MEGGKHKIFIDAQGRLESGNPLYFGLPIANNPIIYEKSRRLATRKGFHSTDTTSSSMITLLPELAVISKLEMNYFHTINGRLTMTQAQNAQHAQAVNTRKGIMNINRGDSI